MQLTRATPIARYFLNTTRFRATFPIRTFIPSTISAMPPKDKYTDPELRDEVKEEIHNGDKGGAPGQWSARKAQMMASEYKKRGGGVSSSHHSLYSITQIPTNLSTFFSTQPTKRIKMTRNNTSPNGEKKTGKPKKAPATQKTMTAPNTATSPKRPGKT